MSVSRRLAFPKGDRSGRVALPILLKPLGASAFPESVPNCSPKITTQRRRTGKVAMYEWLLPGIRIAYLNVRMWALCTELLSGSASPAWNVAIWVGRGRCTAEGASAVLGHVQNVYRHDPDCSAAASRMRSAAPEGRCHSSAADKVSVSRDDSGVPQTNKIWRYRSHAVEGSGVLPHDTAAPLERPVARRF